MYQFIFSIINLSIFSNCFILLGYLFSFFCCVHYIYFFKFYFPPKRKQMKSPDTVCREQSCCFIRLVLLQMFRRGLCALASHVWGLVSCGNENTSMWSRDPAEIRREALRTDYRSENFKEFSRLRLGTSRTVDGGGPSGSSAWSGLKSHLMCWRGRAFIKTPLSSALFELSEELFKVVFVFFSLRASHSSDWIFYACGTETESLLLLPTVWCLYVLMRTWWNSLFLFRVVCARALGINFHLVPRHVQSIFL